MSLQDDLKVITMIGDLGSRVRTLESRPQIFGYDEVNDIVVYNEQGVDLDLRMEGDTEPNLFYLDAGNDRIGIGTNSPNALLDVRGDAIFNEDGGDFDFRIESNTATHLFFVDAGNNRIGMNTNTPANFILTLFRSGAFVFLCHTENAANTVLDTFTLRRTTTVAPAANLGVQFSVQLENTTPAVVSAAQYQVVWLDATAGSEDAVFRFNARVAGAMTQLLQIGSAGIIFNITNKDINTRFETSGGANTLFIDGGNDNVGIGTNAPNASALLELSSTVGAFLIMSMTTVQRNALGAVNGMGIYNTTTNQFEKYQAGAWIAW